MGGGFVKRLIVPIAMVLAMAAAFPCAGQEPAIGKPGDKASASRTVHIDMSDFMLFTPDRITVKKGETILFVVENKGQLDHEFVLGTADDLEAHAAMMKKNPDMVHQDPGHLMVPPGKTKEIAWQFTSTGRVEFACLYPGHYDSGMRGTVSVKQ
jgi:uncharacterized cupredoxin-like copper-binding protein